MNDYYVLVDYDLNEIITHLSPLPQDWNNVYGLGNFDDEKLENLFWAGHPNLGWIRASSKKIFDFSYTQEWFDFTKNKLKSLISEKRKEIQNTVLEYKNNKIVSNEKTKNALFLKIQMMKDQQIESVMWKFFDSFNLITTQEATNLLNALDDYTQRCFYEESRQCSLIDGCNSLEDLLKLDIKKEWPDYNL
jgi:hypothetical protein